jgi:hypothetical protein
VEVGRPLAAGSIAHLSRQQEATIGRRKTNRRFCWLALAIVALLAANCRPGDDLAAGRERWSEAGIGSYTIEVRVISGPWHLQDHAITVRDGEVADATAACTPSLFENGQCEVEPFDAANFTVPGLFAQATQMAQEYGAATNITLDPDYGYPAAIAYDDPDILDEQLTWQVTAFTPGED